MDNCLRIVAGSGRGMDVYQGWFNLREGVSDLDVAAAFSAYMEHLRGKGLI